MADTDTQFELEFVVVEEPVVAYVEEPVDETDELFPVKSERPDFTLTEMREALRNLGLC